MTYQEVLKCVSTVTSEFVKIKLLIYKALQYVVQTDCGNVLTKNVSKFFHLSNKFRQTLLSMIQKCDVCICFKIDKMFQLFGGKLFSSTYFVHNVDSMFSNLTTCKKIILFLSSFLIIKVPTCSFKNCLDRPQT